MSARRLLLISNSTCHGSGYLDHCEDELRRFLAGVERVLFVPFALFDRAGYAAKARERFAELGLGLDSLGDALDDPARAAQMVGEAQAVFTGGGNTFRLLDTLYRLELIEPLRRRALAGMPYVGTSAGTNIACVTVRTTNDMPIVEPPSLSALDLVPFNINPHFLDASPESTHQGETREQRITEFLEENDRWVVGLREGAWLNVEGDAGSAAGKDTVRLGGTTGARIFTRGREPWEAEAGADLSFLLAPPTP